RKIYKILPTNIRLRLLSHLLPEIKLDLKNIAFRTAVTPEDYLSAFNLVYKVFVKTGYTRPSTTPFRLAPQHCNNGSRIFIGIHKDGNTEKLVYSISIFPDSDTGLPMDMVFKNELDLLRSEGRFIVEAGHLAADASYKKNDMNVPMLGNKILHQYASKHLNADDIVIAIHPKHRWFYEDLLLFKKIGEIKEYAYANNNPALAMRLDLRTMKENYENTYRNVLKKNNLYHFFFTAKSNSIILEDQSFSIEKRLLENLKYLYGFRT
ncbi:MAG: N-acyl-L-homoserine lactone synthetase, partial [Proteobacteria bacterium]|nr:N-acyl-L-homoserine lactone synthetase [Pseudomonadota bacterium]